MKVKIENTYHQTVKFFEGKTLNEVIRDHENELKITAWNLAENEVEEDWQDHHKSYDEALKVTYDSILEQLKSEVEYTVEVQEGGKLKNE